jgi:hypothetical protein
MSVAADVNRRADPPAKNCPRFDKRGYGRGDNRFVGIARAVR